MMPAMKLNTPPVTSSQPPHIMALARRSTALSGGYPQTPDGPEPPDGPESSELAPRAASRPARAARQASQAIVTSPISAAGSSQLTCPPMSAANSRVSPAEPPNRGPAPPPKPTEP